ncbi:glutamine amidotransferase [Alteromonadaceae bacterium Bs31]|nr:glutamine amidotransferase [Alteromonadaceae bacterium Bs31]
MEIAVLDYGAGNLRNVCRAIEHLGYQHCLVRTAGDLKTIDKLIIPGVGAFKVAMKQLKERGLVEAIQEYAQQSKPLLGICLGMQLLFDRSSELGETEGLGLIRGSVEVIPDTDVEGGAMKVPHIGWNELEFDLPAAEVIQQIRELSPVYFVHSYRAVDVSYENLVAHCVYGGETIPAIVQKGSVVGCQFHPEKSGYVGLRILSGFLGD